MAEMNNYTRTVRSYEISIWTLQDRFLSVLKWATQDQKGQLQDPEMILRDDGTQELNFSIPKFYWVGPTRIENPMWLHLEDQPLEANMHKLKVIFNKEFEDEKVFEFLVVSVEHNHSGDMVQLNVKAEGLAFHELGKIGYRIKFSQKEFEASMTKWIDEGMNGEMPQENLQYWNDLLFKDVNGHWKGNWRYEVRMDWSSYSYKAARSSEIVYEDEYVSSWHVDDSGVLSPRETELHKEKWRAVEASESNLYNITQTIAEEFGIFCRYEYEHDENYHILPESYDEEGNPIPSRKVIYYNNYYYDIDGHIDLTYPYSSSAITRTVDSSNITTKLYVNKVDYDDKNITIMDVEANKSNEDYLLNFDYLHEIQAITEEQYAEVERYEAAMHILNKEISRLQERKRILDNQLIDISAQVTLLTNSVQQDKERMDDANRAKSEVTSGHEDIPINQPMTIIKDTSNNWGNYITTTRWPGLNESSIQLYENSTFIVGEKQYSDLIRGFTPIRDENNMISHLVNIARTEDDDNTIYLQATYNPYDYYEKLAALWQNKKDLDAAELDRVKELELMYNWYLTGSRVGYARVDYMLVDDAYYPVGIVCVSDDMDNPEPWSVDATRSDRVGFMRVLTDAAEADMWLAQDPKQDPFADLDIETSTPDIVYYLEDYLKRKAARFNAFEKMMGPAMREGYWSPEEYHDYGDKYRDSALIYKSGMPAENKGDLFQTPYAQLIWDSDKYFSGESAILYDVGVDMRPNPHLTVDLSNCLEAVCEHLDDLCFIYADPSTLTALEDLEQSKQELIQKVANTQPLWHATNTSYINRVPFNDETSYPEFTNIVNKTNPNGANDEKIVKLYRGYTNIDSICNNLKPYYTENDSKEIDPCADSYTLDELSNRISELTALKKLFNDIVTLENESPQISGYSNRCTWARNQAKLVEQLYTHLETDFYDIRKTSGISIPGRIAILKENIYRVYRIKADCELGWVKIEGTNETSYKPVLFVTGADELDDESIDCIMTGWYPIEVLNVVEEKYVKDYSQASENFHPCLGLYETIVNESGNDVTYKITRLYDILWQRSSSYESRNYSNAFVAGKRDIEQGNYDRNGNLRWPKPEDYYIKRIYPRIYFNTLKVKNNSDDIKVSINNNLLTNNNDYYCVEDDRSKGLKSLGIGYYLTFRPEVLYSLTSDYAVIDLIYSLSNIDTAIYLDALKVMRENAYPKVSYNVELSVLNPEFIHRAYDRLNQIVYINDNDLNLDDVSGYISSVTMRLDRPWEDQVEIKNYETKFEDLFSTIVSQTEAMKKSAGGITAALQAFSSNGLLTEETITNSLAQMDLNLAFNSGKLSISERDGIEARSGESGSEQILAIRGGGIFTSTEKDENGNWIWNTAILPSGINANLITTGQLDTSKIKIYAKNEVRFQLNGDGLFAYKPFNVENEYMQSAITQANFVQPTNGIDSLQYVVYNSDGLALIAKQGTWYRDSKETQIAINAETAELSQVLSYKQTVHKEIKRVEVSWDGFILRNWQNEKVFYADPDTGNLTLKGAISADSGDIGQWRITPRMLTGHGIHLVSVEDSSDLTETGSAGIYLTDKKDYIETEIIDGVSYYIYIDDDGEEFYSQEIAFDHHSFAAGKQIYRKVERLNTVIPKYLLSVFESEETAPVVNTGSIDYEWDWNERINDYELVIHANPTATQNNVKTIEKQYIVKDAESTHGDPSSSNTHYALDINKDKIVYDGNISPTSTWYNAVVEAAEAAQDDYTKYITELTYKIYEKVTLNAALLGRLKTNPSVQFSVKADTGEVYIKQGEIGNYSVKVNSDDTTTAILHSSLLTKDNAIIADKNSPDDEPLSSLGKLFCEASLNNKQFTLKRVDGSLVNFNMAGMQWYKDAISAASKITLTLTFSNGKVIAMAKTQKDKDALDNPSDSGTVVATATKSWDGQTKRTYIATATSGGGVTVQRTLTLEPTGASSGEGNGGGGSGCASCTSECSRGCATNCGGGCKEGCKHNCGNNCVGSCSGECYQSCTGGCGTGCGSACTRGCATTCNSNCGGGCVWSCRYNAY